MTARQRRYASPSEIVAALPEERSLPKATESFNMRWMRILIVLVLASPFSSVPPAGAHDRDCRGEMGFDYSASKMTWFYVLQIKDCARGMGDATFRVKVSLQRCDATACSTPMKKTIKCRPGDRCRATLTLAHPEIESATYDARWSYKGEGRSHIHSGTGTERVECLSTPVHQELC